MRGGGRNKNNPMDDAVETTTAATRLECKDPVEMVLQSIDDLYMVRDTFFPLDPSIKKARLENLLRDVLLVLNEISSGVYIVALGMLVFVRTFLVLFILTAGLHW